MAIGKHCVAQGGYTAFFVLSARGEFSLSFYAIFNGEIFEVLITRSVDYKQNTWGHVIDK